MRERSNRDLAIAVLDKAQSDLLSAEREPDFRLTQAMIRIYANVGAKDKALRLVPQMEKEVQDLMLKNPQDPLPNFYLAQVYRSLGEYQKALPIFQQLASLYPDDPQLKQEVEELKRLANSERTLDSSTLTKEKLN